MQIITTTSHLLLLAPPVDLPMRLLTPFGSLKADTTGIAPADFPCPTNRIRPEGDPPEDKVYKFGIHEAIDLYAEAGSCVYASYPGTLAEIRADGITVVHHEPESFSIDYIHIDHAFTVGVDEGTFFQMGAHLGEVMVPRDPRSAPHLHYEVRIILDTGGPQTVKKDTAIDPTRTLYDWEGQHGETPPDSIYVFEGPSTQPRWRVGPASIQEIGAVRLDHYPPWDGGLMIRPSRLPFFEVRLDPSCLTVGPTPLTAEAEEPLPPFLIPLYEPCTQHELEMVGVLRDAFNAGRRVTLQYRESVFFGEHAIITAVRVSN